MHITGIELENIKSYAASSFEFTRGTTAITGPNGAGKTTLIEAIAWALFDVLDYKKEDFVRRGTKRGSVRVTFESGLDERLYTVYRDTGAGYNVYDPALKTRIADKKEEVTRFLWQHLGVEPGTDLDSLYRRAIGVPQGTFTAIFLEAPAERKKAFDKLLKVEEYRRGAEELLKTARYVEQQAVLVREKIARAEGEIARIDAVEEEHKTVSTEIGKLDASVKAAILEVVEKQSHVDILNEAERVLRAAADDLNTIQAEHAKRALLLAQEERDLSNSRAAAVKISDVKSDFERHTKAVLRLRDLERERAEREKLRSNLAAVETALAAVRADQKYSREALENALKAHAIIGKLRTAAADQERLEGEVEKLRDAAAHSRAIRNQIGALDEKIARLRDSYRTNTTRLAEATTRSEKIEGLDKLEKRDAEIVRELAALHASLDRDERFQKEIKDGLCPVLSQKCLNLKEGETLDDFVTSKFGELRTRIAVLETEHGQISFAIRTSREGEKFLAQISILQSREKEIADEGKRLNDEKAALVAELEKLPKIEDQLAQAEGALKALDNPKGKIQILESDAGRERELREKLSTIESNLERLESDRRIIVEQLESYKDFDAHWSGQTVIRDETSDAFRVYVANEKLANSVGDLEQKVAAAKKEIEETELKHAKAKEALGEAGKKYDRERHDSERAILLDLLKRQAQLGALLESANRRVSELALELERLVEIKKSMLQEFQEKERLEKIAELTTFIRDTLKEAAPLVARNYVFHVAIEANQLFREITGSAEHTLKWTEDYSITLEENGYDRPFISLSGGEQMAAALSVRLALLKQLADIRIAFFDEPTTNMDAERRENLAVQLSHITHFDQLFVISHDDTFEGYVDNLVTVERSGDDQALQQAL